MTGELDDSRGIFRNALRSRDLGAPHYEPTVKGPVARVVACGNGSPRAHARIRLSRVNAMLQVRTRKAALQGGVATLAHTPDRGPRNGMPVRPGTPFGEETRGFVARYPAILPFESELTRHRASRERVRRLWKCSE